MTSTAALTLTWIQHLRLTEHIEGGWYSEVYRSPIKLDQLQLPASFTGDRDACTHIYFLLTAEKFSAFHRIKSDELWHFYQGDAITIYEINSSGNLIEHLLGSDPTKGETLFTIIRAGHWFASRVNKEGSFGLAGCTVVPGFDFEDFEMAKMEQLLADYPRHENLIRELCR